MKTIEELCTLIKCNPKSLVDIDWGEETDGFDIPRMHELVLNLDDIELINSVSELIIAEYNYLLSQDDPRCFKSLNNGGEIPKFPDRTDYSNEPIIMELSQNISTSSISGVLFLCKKEALRKLLPKMEHEEIRAKVLEQYSQPSNVEQENNNKKEVLPEPVTLKFFGQRLYVTSAEQQNLREILKESLHEIDVTNGRDWFAYFAAYRYVQKQNSAKIGYVDFFTDIELLLPGVLTMLNTDKKGDKRYKHYTSQIAKEANNWFVDKGKLPPINNLVYSSYHFGCHQHTFDKLEKIIKVLFKKISQLEKELRM